MADRSDPVAIPTDTGDGDSGVAMVRESIHRPRELKAAIAFDSELVTTPTVHVRWDCTFALVNFAYFANHRVFICPSKRERNGAAMGNHV